MKKLLTLSFFAIVFMCQRSSAQIQKGETMLGLSLDLGISNVKEEAPGSTLATKVRAFQISPQVGIGLGNNWIAGIVAGYSHTRQKGNAAVKYTSKGVSGGAFVRKFYPVGAGKFGIFGQGNVQYEHERTEYPSNYIAKTNTMGVSIQPGAYVRATKRFIVEASVGNIGYTHSTLKADLNAGQGESTSDSFVFSLTNQLALGFKFVL